MDKKYCLGLYEKAMPGNLTMAEKLTAAREAGYDYLEMSVDETDEKLARLNMSREERKELTLLMEKTGMPIRSMCLSGHRRYSLGSAEGAEQSLCIMEKAIELADDLGIRIIQLAGYDVYYESSTYDTKKRFLDNLRKAAAMAEKTGILLGFETMETEFMNTVEKAMKYVCLVDSPYLQIYPDIGNLTNIICRSDFVSSMTDEIFFSAMFKAYSPEVAVNYVDSVDILKKQSEKPGS